MNIHVLATDNPSRLYYHSELKQLVLTNKIILRDVVANQNIYITSDEKIKEGDWYINTFVSEKEQKPQTHTEKRHLINHQKDYRFKYCKKVILTTDPQLIAKGVQAIDDDFLEWFVKNPSCEEVEVLIEKRTWKEINWIFYYKITIPKEEPKQDEIMERFIANAKQQETLEEASKRLCLNIKERVGFYKCYSWQQERSYSEEDLKEAFKQSRQALIFEKNMPPVYESFEEWFEQFKNK
jgi:hypothetical protein